MELSQSSSSKTDLAELLEAAGSFLGSAGSVGNLGSTDRRGCLQMRPAGQIWAVARSAGPQRSELLSRSCLHAIESAFGLASLENRANDKTGYRFMCKAPRCKHAW